MAEARLHRSSIVTSLARSYCKRTRSVVEAQKSQVLQMPALPLRFRIFRRSAMIAIRTEAPSSGMGVLPQMGANAPRDHIK